MSEFVRITKPSPESGRNQKLLLKPPMLPRWLTTAMPYL